MLNSCLTDAEDYETKHLIERWENTSQNKPSQLAGEVDWRTSLFSEIKITKYYVIHENMIRKLTY